MNHRSTFPLKKKKFFKVTFILLTINTLFYLFILFNLFISLLFLVLIIFQLLLKKKNSFIFPFISMAITKQSAHQSEHKVTCRMLKSHVTSCLLTNRQEVVRTLAHRCSIMELIQQPASLHRRWSIAALDGFVNMSWHQSGWDQAGAPPTVKAKSLCCSCKCVTIKPVAELLLRMSAKMWRTQTTSHPFTAHCCCNQSWCCSVQCSKLLYTVNYFTSWFVTHMFLNKTHQKV